MATKQPKAGLATLPPKPTAAADDFVATGMVQTPGPQAPKAPEAAKAVSLEAAPIQDEEPTQRLTLEIPLSLHVTIKSGCAVRRTKMKEEVLALLESHYRKG